MTHQIDVSKGTRVGTVSNQWAMRDDDQRFLNLSDLRNQVATWASESHAQEVMPANIRALFDKNNPGYLAIDVDGTIVDPSHWGFDQICRVAAAPASYMRHLPGPLAAVNLNYGLAAMEKKPISAYLRQPQGETSTMLRGLTSNRYGRILDVDVVDSVMKVAGNGVGDTRWKVPGTIDWTSKFGVSYNPEVDITKENTTLYASDRDVFLFLVDDMNPIEVGKLSNGAPDLMFRGFYVWNSEVGSRTFGFASMYLRGVCQNRNLWGVEDFNEIVFRHTSGAPDRFVEQAEPALLGFANSSESRLITGVKAAKNAIVAQDKDERLEFLAKFGFSQKGGQLVIDTCVAEEEKAPESLWDFAQGVSALARRETLQEDRLKMETVAGKILDRVKVPA